MVNKHYTYSFKAMGSTITIQAELEENQKNKIFKEIENFFQYVETIATRFNSESELSIINNTPNQSNNISPTLQDLIKQAYQAYQQTEGMFDPRILKSLSKLGYAYSFENGQLKTIETTPYLIREKWEPIFNTDKITIGPEPIDLGGIGKSYTVMKAAKILEQHTDTYFINAGGDIVFKGLTPEGKKWTVGVDNPYSTNSVHPIAVLELTNTAIATSSSAKKTWLAEDGRRMHHIINPTTGLPADTGINSVTVINKDLTQAEIWSKTLFLQTSEQIAQTSEENNLAVLWTTEDHQMHYTPEMHKHIIWPINQI